ncbi:hypothetical protein GCM10017691_05770 [Pseudonocardia petroleophila]|uniref:serine/threonine-protein kinase n=1 Tax=Pseudonocardia petroleophila TaxID=37331 RepID=UPI001C8BD8D6|nr:serine/threonine-protein kinase [Pseudonocardia petroleophila]
MTNETFGPYRLESLIGRGGMGEVFRAHDTVRNRTVALKRLPASLAGDTGFQERFRREAQLVARLRDGHVIPIHDFGEIDGQLFIDMRLVDGADLRTVLDWIGPMPPERAVRIAGQVARALDAAHADGLVHRDVKPSNILLSGATRDPGADVDDYAYLVDFGIVASAGDVAGGRLTATGAAIGTVEYMSPERFLNGTGDRRIDVYALGCVLHEMLTGARPFSGTGPQQMWAHVNTPPPRPSLLRPGLPAALDDVIAAALAKDPDDRIPTAGELASRARAALATAPGSGPTVRHTPIPAADPPSPSAVAPPTAAPRAAAAPPAPEPPTATFPTSGPEAPTRFGAAPAAGSTARMPQPPPGSSAGPPASTDGTSRRWWPIAAAALVVVLVAAGTVWALNRRTAEEAPPADAAGTTITAVEEPQVDDPVAELASYADEALLATCDEAVAGDGAPVRASANCGEWAFDLYSSAAEAATVVRDNNGGTIEPGSPCATRPEIDAYHVERFDRGVLGCRAYDGEYVVEWAVDGIPVVGVRDEGDETVSYEAVYEEALRLSAEVS